MVRILSALDSMSSLLTENQLWGFHVIATACAIDSEEAPLAAASGALLSMRGFVLARRHLQEREEGVVKAILIEA